MNTEKIEKLKKSLSNSLLPADLKPKIEAEIKRLEDLDSKQPKKTSKANPSKTKTPKRTAMSLAKEIRKEGESWNDARARASKMMKDKSNTATKDAETELTKLAEGGYLTDLTFGTFQNQVFADGGGVDEFTHNLKYLTSKKVYFDITTGKVYPKINLKPNMSKGKSIDEYDDKWFETLNDRDLATVQNYINNRKEFADGGGVGVETILFAVKKGEPDWNEVLITNNPAKIEDAKKWALANGFDRLRVSKIDMNEKPDFEKTFAKSGSLSEVYDVDISYKQIQGNLGRFPMTEKTAEKLSDTFYFMYFDLYDTTDKKPMSYNQVSKIITESMKEKGLYENGGFMDGVYADGGKLPNNYKDKKPEEVWNNWTTSQRKHFLKDHRVFVLLGEERGASLYRYDELPKDKLVKIENKLKEHISEGQYAKGGYTQEGENYEYINTFDIPQKDFIKLVEAYHKSPSYNQSERIESRLIFSDMRSKYGMNKVDEIGNYIHETHEENNSSDDYYAKGGGVGYSQKERVIDYYYNNDVFDDYETYGLSEDDLNNENKVVKAIIKYHDLDDPKMVKERFNNLGLDEYAKGGNINKNTTKMRKQKLKKGDTVTVIGKRWFDRVNGNTYHTAEVEVNGKSIGKSPMTYGYDDQYLETGKEILLQQYDFPRGMTERSPMWQLRDNGVTLKKSVTDGLKRELAKGGGVKMINGREYNYGRVWTKDHNEFDKGSDHEVEYRRKKKFELGGVMTTDLAGHTGGTLGTGDPSLLSGNSGTAYTGLVGETGAMSSGEMFMAGGGVGDKYYVGKFQTVRDWESFVKPNGVRIEKDVDGYPVFNKNNDVIYVYKNKKQALEKAEILNKRYNNYELGGVMTSDLAGHTGGTLGTGDPSMLDAFSNTAYTGLVGETGAMSSGEMFMNGGGVKSNSTFRANQSSALRYANFEDGSHINLLELNPLKRGGLKHKSEYKYAISVSTKKDGQKVLNFKNLENAENIFEDLVNERKKDIALRNEGKTNNYELGGGLPTGVSQPYMITEALGNPAQHFAKGGGVRTKNGQTYNYGRVWTKDHNEFDKGSDHEVEYRRKKSSFFAKGGAMENIEYDDVLEVLKEKLEGAIDELPREYEFANDFKGEEVEKQSRDGFIAFTDGGYEVTWFEQMSMFSGSGYGLPTKPLDDEMQRQINYNYQLAKETFIENYPEIAEELGEENIDYNSLYEAGYESEAEELSEMENDDGDDTIMCEIGGYYYDTENYRGIDEKHTIRLYGLVNLESPYHRRGNLDDSYDIDITFDSISELKEKVDAGLKEIIDWFDGKYYNDSDAEMKIRRMANGGSFAPNVSNGTEFMSGVYADGGFMDGVYAKGGKVSPFKNIMETNTITEKEINLIKMRMNNDKVDEATQEVIDYIWDNSPQLTPDQNKKGIDYLRNLWKSPTGKERTNNPFGYREQDTLETFEYFELRGFYDAGNRYRKFYVPLYTCVGADSNFEYAFYNGEVNILG